MGGVGIHAVNAPGRNNADGRIFFIQHIADLNRRGVGAQYVAVFHVKGVLHSARRMVGGNIQRLEIVKIVFDFRAVGHFKAHAVKQLDNALQGEGNRVQTAAALAAAGQSHIQGFGGQLGLQLGFVERIAAAIEGCLKPVFAFIDVGAHGFALVRAHLTQGFQQRVQFAGFAQIAGFNQLQCV